jgi:pyridoxamine 5'-phosphate oxidase
MSLSRVRREYAQAGLRKEDLAADPIEQLQRWLADAAAADPDDYTSMTLATADRDGRPSARIVLLKGCDERGLVFYTNYDSRKGRELAANPRAALVFYWAVLDRQVRIEGRVEKISRKESEAYFRSRPLGARVGASISRQSSVITDRSELEQAAREITERYGEDPPLPDFWGGYRVVPEEIEFWQGRPDRLHDRLRYRRGEGAEREGGWVIERLSP